MKDNDEIKIKIGVVHNPDASNALEIKGRDLVSGLPKKITISEIDTYSALTRSIDEIVKESKAVLEKTEPELTSDIINQGIVLTGGGSLLRNLDVLLEEKIGDAINYLILIEGMFKEDMEPRKLEESRLKYNYVCINSSNTKC